MAGSVRVRDRENAAYRKSLVRAHRRWSGDPGSRSRACTPRADWSPLLRPSPSTSHHPVSSNHHPSPPLLHDDQPLPSQPSQRVRVRMALNKAQDAPVSDISSSSKPILVPEPTSSGISTAINIHPPKTPSSPDDRSALHHTLSTSSSSSSVSSGFGAGGGQRGGVESSSSSSSGALGLEGTGITLGPAIGGDGAISGGRQAIKGRRVPKGLCECSTMFGCLEGMSPDAD